MGFMRISSFSFRPVAAIVLILFGIFGRLLLRFPNVETVTAATLLAGVLLGGWYSVIVPLCVIAITDMLIGNTNILLYTWSAWVLIGVGALLFNRWKRFSKYSGWVFAGGMAGLGVVSSVFFFVWTNFGVWHLDGLYPHTLSGLEASYIAGLPFLKYSLVGNMVIVPIASFAFQALFQLPYRKFFGKILHSHLP